MRSIPEKQKSMRLRRMPAVPGPVPPEGITSPQSGRVIPLIVINIIPQKQTLISATNLNCFAFLLNSRYKHSPGYSFIY
jgi:hypothetical protein